MFSFKKMVVHWLNFVCLSIYMDQNFRSYLYSDKKNIDIFFLMKKCYGNH